MANKFWNAIKGAAQSVFGGNKDNTSTGSSDAGNAASAQPAQAVRPAAIQSNQSAQTNASNSQPAIISYNSGIRGTREYAQRNNDAFQQQWQLAKSAGVSKNNFYQEYANGTRWLDQANNASTGIRQYDSGVAGTREYAKAHNDEFQAQWKLAKQAGLEKEDFYREYGRGQRWTTDIEDKPTNLSVANGTAEQKTLAEDEDYSRDWRAKLHTGLFDNAIANAIEDRRLKRLQEKYGNATFDDNFLGQFKASFGSARIQEEYMQALADYMDNPTDDNRQYKDDLKALLDRFQVNNMEVLDDQNVQAGWLSQNLASYFPQLWNQTKASIVPLAVGGALEVATGGLSKGTFLKLGATAGSGIYSYNSMRGAAFDNLTGVGIDENTARNAANDEAIVSSIIEMGDTAVDLFTMIPGLGSAAKNAAKDAALKSASKSFLKLLGEYGFNIGEEYGEEFVQELLSMANQRRCLNGDADSGIKGLLAEATKLAGEMLGGEAKDELAQANEAGVGGAIIGAFMGAVNIGTGQAYTAYNNNQIVKALGRLDDNNIGGYSDENLQKMLNAAVDPTTQHEDAAQLIRSEMDRRAAYDQQSADIDTGGILKTVDPKASEKAQQQVTEENRKTLDNLKREDISPDKVDDAGLAKLFREAQRIGSRRGYLVVGNELEARMAEERNNSRVIIPNAEAQEWTGEVPEGAARIIAEQKQAPVTEAPVNPAAEAEQAAPAAVETEQAAETQAAAEEAPVVAQPTGNVIIDQQAQREEQLTVEQRKAMYREMSPEQLRELLAHAKAVGDIQTQTLVTNELNHRTFLESEKRRAEKKNEKKAAPFGKETPRPGESQQDVLLRAIRKEENEKSKAASRQEREGNKFRDTGYDIERDDYEQQFVPQDFTAWKENEDGELVAVPIEGYEKEFEEYWATHKPSPVENEETVPAKDTRKISEERRKQIEREREEVELERLRDAVSGKVGRIVDGNVVVETTGESGEQVDVVSVGSSVSNDGKTVEDVYLTAGGNKIMPAAEVGKNVEEFAEELKEYGVEKTVFMSGPFRNGTVVDGKVNDGKDTLGGHTNFAVDENGHKYGIFAFSTTKNGIVPHEMGHRAVYLARENDFTRANTLLTDALHGAFKKDYARVFSLLKNQEGYEGTIQDAFLGWIREHPGRSDEQYLSDYSTLETLIIENEMSSYLLEGATITNDETGELVFNFADYTSAFRRDENFIALVQMAAEEDGWSQRAVDNLHAFLKAHNRFVNKNGRGATVDEAANLFHKIITERRRRDRNAEQRLGAGFGESGRQTLGGSERGAANQDAGWNGPENRPSGNVSKGNGKLVQGDQNEGIISRFVNSPEAQQTVGERRITHGDVENESLSDIDAAYESTFGEPISEDERWMHRAPRDVTAEEREVAAQKNYEEDEQRAEDAKQNARNRARIEHGRHAAGIFAAAKNISTLKLGEDGLDTAFKKVRDAAESVADGRLSPGNFAEFYVNMQRDLKLSQFTLPHVVEAMEDMLTKYKAALDNGNEYNKNRYAQAAEKAMTLAEHSFRQINDAFRVQRRMSELIKQNGKAKAKSKSVLVNLARGAKDFYLRMQISPENMFRGIIGDWDSLSTNEAYRLANDITAANIENQHIIAGSQMAFAPLRKVDGMEAFTRGEDKVKVTTPSGFNVDLSEVELAHLYKAIKTLEAEQKRFGDRLDTLAGFAFGDRDNPTFYNIQDDIKNSGVTAAEYLREARDAIYDKLSDAAKKYIDAVDGVLEDLAKRNSDVEMKVNGVRPMMYKKGDYIHLSYANPNKTYNPIQAENIDFGFLNERTRSEGGFVRIAPLTSEVDRYIRQSANHIAYSGLARTFELLNRDTEAGGENIVSLMEKNYGKQFSEWMQNFIEDVSDFNPQERTDGISSLLRAGRQAVQTGALVGSVSVPIKQISSYWAASGKLRMSSLVKAYRPKGLLAPKKGQFASNKQNSLLLYNRKAGGIAPELSEAMGDNGIWGKLKKNSKVLQLIDKAIPYEDYLTVSNVYDACIVEMKEDHSNMDINSPEFAELVENKFEEVVMETQPIFTKNARPEYARTDNEFIKMLAMFRTQQTQNLNRVMRSIGEYKAAKGTAGEFLAYSTMAETIKGQAASAMSLAILSMTADVVLHKLRKYRDDDDEFAPEKILERFGMNAIETAAGTAWFGDTLMKWAIDKINAAQGKDSNEFYGVNMGIISTMKNVVDSVGWFLDSPTLSNARYVAGYLAQTLGIPLNNAYQLLNSATMYASDILGANEDHYDDVLKMLDKEIIATSKDSEKNKANVLVNAYMRGNEAKADSVSDLMDPNKQDSTVKAKVKEEYLSGNLSDQDVQNILLRYTGMDTEAAQKSNEFWEFLQQNPKYDDVTESFVQKYNEFAEPANIPVNSFYEYMQTFNNTKSIDIDRDGKANGKGDITKQSQIIQYINGLDISKEQKDALWQAFGYKTTTKTYQNRPWR